MEAQIYFNNNYEIGALVHGSTSVIEDSLGEYLILGQEITGSYRAINFIKADINGDTLWTKSFPRNQYAYYTGYSNSLIETKDNGYTFGGTVINLLDTTNEGDALLVKLDNNLDTLWTKQFGGTALDVANISIECSDSGFVLIGSTNSYGSGQSDFYMVKTDNNGNFQWQKTFGTAAQEEAYSGIQTLDNGFVLSGYQGSQLYIVKTDSSGNFQWQKTFSGTAGQGFIEQLSDSTYILVGSKNVSGFAYQAYMAKLTSTGTIIWSQTYGGAGDQQFYAIPIILNDGSIVCSGISTLGTPWGLLVKVDSFGNEKWVRTFYKSSTIYNDFFDVKQTIDDGFVMTGTTFVTTQDSWLVKVDSNGCEIANCNVGIEELQSDGLQLKVYPNPCNDYATVEIRLSETQASAKLIVYNLLGSEIIEQKVINNETYIIDTKEYNNGIYFFVLSTEAGIVAREKIIVSK
ncbi:MAG TPA: T9SS type A sorting domain-containing protein [Bacteroidia bacterium]|nr:T9SS type A sorting domain-containing protein [Bacteroidia bacterium]